MELTHASFFSGVGGLDLGLERAGWRTVSFSEIDPYASAVLAERWPGVPNLGDITALVDRWGTGDATRVSGGRRRGRLSDSPRSPEPPPFGDATLWSGGFPCQDLSVAGKRRGFAGERSVLAFAFLDLVERHRPPAILLENVPGLLSSHGGKDFGRLLSEMGNLGYRWAYRVLDAQFFGVPQRRRRVFVVALNSESGFGADSAAAVLSVGSRCDGHSATGDTPRPAASDGLAAGFARSLSTSQWRIDADTESFIVRPSPDPGGVRATDGLAGRLDDRAVAYRKSARVSAPGTPETWVDDGLANTLNSFDVGDIRTTHIALGGGSVTHDEMLPLGLDSHRYRACGNGVVADVAEWIGVRIAAAVQGAGVQS